MKTTIEELNAALLMAEDENEQCYSKWADDHQWVICLREKMTEVGATADMVRQTRTAEGDEVEAFERWCQATTMVELLQQQIKMVEENA